MGHGILHVDYAVLKGLMFLPDDCQIISIQPSTNYGQASVGLIIASPSIPESEYVLPVTAISTQEVPPEHECPEGFQCKKITTRLEVNKY